MSMYTDWFIAEEAAAKAIAESEDPFRDRWPHLQLNSILDIELTWLHGILLGKTNFDPKLEVTDATVYIDQALMEQIGVINENFGPSGVEPTGVIMTRVKPAFIERLAELTPQKQQEVAATWAKIDELVDWQFQAVEAVLNKIVKFAQQAQQLKKPIVQMFVM